MNLEARHTQRLLWLGLALVGATLLLAALPPLFKLQRANGKSLPVYATVNSFTLTNLDGRPLSLADLRGHVWVADIIFTRCAGPCPRMTRQMKALQDALPANSSARLVTLTTDAEFDTPPVLRKYAQRFGADTNRWFFLTGRPEQIAAVATGSLKLAAVAKKPGERLSPEDLFIHSTLFVVIDKQGRLRAIVETDPDHGSPEQVRSQLLNTINRLEREHTE